MSKFLELHTSDEEIILLNPNVIQAVDSTGGNTFILAPDNNQNLKWVQVMESYEDVKEMLGVLE